MSTMKLLLTLFDLDELGTIPESNRPRLLTRVGLMTFLLLLLFFFLAAAATLWIAWVAGDVFWFAHLFLLYASVFPALVLVHLFFPQAAIPAWPLRSDFIALQHAAMASDETLAPLAASQPPRTAERPERVSMDTVGPLTRLPSSTARSSWLMPFVASLCLVGGIVPLGLITFPLPDTFTVDSLSTLSAWRSLGLLLSTATLSLVSLWLLAVGLFGLWRMLRSLADLGIRVDEQGISWRRRSWDRGLTITKRWSEAKAFYMISYKAGRHWTTRTVYALDFGAAILAWEVVAISNRYASAKAQARERATREVSERLCAEIARHTQLPLRDVTALALRIAAMNGAATREPETNPLARALLAYTDSQSDQPHAPGLTSLSRTDRAWRLGLLAILTGYGVLMGLATFGALLQLGQL